MCWLHVAGSTIRDERREAFCTVCGERNCHIISCGTDFWQRTIAATCGTNLRTKVDPTALTMAVTAQRVVIMEAQRRALGVYAKACAPFGVQAAFRLLRRLLEAGLDCLHQCCFHHQRAVPTCILLAAFAQ
eukprot:SAG11_NODE_637_length_8033_cov_4.585707_7_plen_131_part_00